MRIIFFGSPQEAVDSLESLITAGHDVAGVYTRPDRRAGRGRTKTPTPVRVFAEKIGLPVSTPAGFRDNDVDRTRLRDANADVFVVVAYGRILPADVLKIPPLGVVNVHPSLLPMYRGPSPVVTAVLDGQTHVGVSVMLLDEGMDTGPVIAQSPPIRLTGRERASELQARLFKEGAGMLPAVLTGLEDGTTKAMPQDESKATVTRLVERADGEIDWQSSAEHIDRIVRAYDSWPGTFTSWNGKSLKIVDVEFVDDGDAQPLAARGLGPGKVVVVGERIFVGTGTEPVEVTRLQLEGRPTVPASDFVRGRPDIDTATLTGQG